jgi:2-polyprenyl-3-methyl-5-hydroxy-6-metoxy-1,4-benzoquinol methylase
MNKGWFTIPRVRKGDRTIQEQRMGLEKALETCKGKTVLDIGCAEGLISREFALAGAVSVLGIEVLATHVLYAKQVCQDLKAVSFICTNVVDYARTLETIPKYDIVLALGVIHKLPDPNVPLRFAATSAKDLLLFRAPAVKHGGMVKAKHGNVLCDVDAVMKSEGFEDIGTYPGVRGEAVQYWKRTQS